MYGVLTLLQLRQSKIQRGEVCRERQQVLVDQPMQLDREVSLQAPQPSVVLLVFFWSTQLL